MCWIHPKEKSILLLLKDLKSIFITIFNWKNRKIWSFIFANDDNLLLLSPNEITAIDILCFAYIIVYVVTINIRVFHELCMYLHLHNYHLRYWFRMYRISLHANFEKKYTFFVSCVTRVSNSIYIIYSIYRELTCLSITGVWLDQDK